ncbi:MAG TPA: PIN domain-containing protein [Candidatus Binatia bacterium]|nr:PIN domain-containing protein [Candidatus Binatia bacterium]
MYLVDTAVWIHALRPGGHEAIRARFGPLVIAGQAAVSDWIILELMTGLRREETARALLARFEAIRRLPLANETWQHAWDNAAALRRRGVTVTAADCLVATLAMDHDVALLHCDSDFEAMKPVLGLRTVDWSGALR